MTTRTMIVVLAVGVLAAALVPAANLWADTPAVASSAGSVGAPSMSDVPPSDERTPAPDVDEWRRAERVSFERPLPVDCEARRVREWVRLTCQRPGGAVLLVAGPSEGFSAATYLTSDPSTLRPKGSYHVQFPVRRGERRVVEVRESHFGEYQGLFAAVEFFVVSSWLPGQPPRLLVQRP